MFYEAGICNSRFYFQNVEGITIQVAVKSETVINSRAEEALGHVNLTLDQLQN